MQRGRRGFRKVVGSVVDWEPETFSPTFAHGADEAPRQVRPAGDGAAAFDLVTPGTGDADRLSDAEVRLGARPAAVVPPAGRRWAALGCKEE